MKNITCLFFIFLVNLTNVAIAKTFDSKDLVDTIPTSGTLKNDILFDNNENVYNYFQKGLDTTLHLQLRPLLIKPFDNLNIYFSTTSGNTEQITAFSSFNLSITYSVDELGNIKLPLIGNLSVIGKTCINVSDTIEKILETRNLIKSPSVLVKFEKLKINIMGEFTSPGSKNFNSERVTLLDAILAGGGITEMGIKNDIRIIREENGHINIKHVNLYDASFIGSAEYQLEQNDIVYVDADKYKLSALKRNRKTFLRDFNTVISLASGIFLLVNLIALFK